MNKTNSFLLSQRVLSIQEFPHDSFQSISGREYTTGIEVNLLYEGTYQYLGISRRAE
jgi:hypothetical protein